MDMERAYNSYRFQNIMAPKIEYGLSSLIKGPYHRSAQESNIACPWVVPVAYWDSENVCKSSD